MLVSYKWLQEYFEHNLPEIEKLVDLLTLKSFEIEGYEKIESEKGFDYIIEVDVLPNRSHDCLSHRGVAKEIATITGSKFNDLESPENSSDFKTDFAIECEDEKLCRRYVGCEIKNVQVFESPKELKEKLKALGQKSINNIVDITNIVMYEIGQPMHAFDSDKLIGQKIKIRKAGKDEKITTLDNKEVDLDESILVIADEKKPLAIAGIKGGKNAEVNTQTKNIFLESANFAPANIRKTARKINITTDSSKRFENEITPELAEKALNRAVELIMQYAATDKTTVSNKVDFYPRKWRNYRTGFSLQELNNLLGVVFEEKEVAQSLEKLHFKYELLDPREKIISEAEMLLGRPYKYGASVFFDSPQAFDCSSFVSYVYSLAGYSIPRMAVDQFVFAEKINKKDLLPGDLVFSNTEELKNKIDFESVEFLKGTKIESGVDHVGIYLENNQIVHATSLNDSGVIIEYLNSSDRFKNIVGCGRIIKNSEKRFAVESTPERLDIKTSADLIEEVGRVLGYDRIEMAEIKLDNFSPKINKNYQLNNLLKNIFVQNGFSEIITYSFVKEGTLEPMKPISEDKAFVRNTLLIGMEDALEKNARNADLLGLDQIKLFEIGKVFEKVSGEKFDEYIRNKFPESQYVILEKTMLSIGVKNKNGVKNQKTYETLNKIISEISEKIGVNFNVKINEQTECVEICLDNLIEDIDFSNLGEKYYDLPLIENIKYKTISQYPFILRDIAVWVPKDISANQIMELIKKETGDLLVNYKLFDVYEKDGRISFAHNLVFQSQEKTLTDDEINLIMNSINESMAQSGWEVR